MAIYPGRPSPAGSSGLPGSRRAALRPLFGLASDGVYMCPGCCQPGGSLLHCPSTLTADWRGRPFGHTRPPAAVYFCCTVLGVASTRRYLASCPVKPGLSSPAAFRRLQLRPFILLRVVLVYHNFLLLSSTNRPSLLRGRGTAVTVQTA